ncbi:MAG TPA: GNAT family N-acetyltransferase [Patescibacteria group bacterium]|nr:GNAT family N-acetyltransferase [Patescibacteria group bacterium]
MSEPIFRIIESVDEAKEIWDRLSPHKTIDDEWAFRYTFIRDLPYKIHFIVAYEADQPVAFLPLQLNNREGLQPPYAPTDIDFLEFFGGDDTDDNGILQKETNKSREEAILKQVKSPCILAPLASETLGGRAAELYTSKYVLPLAGYKNYEEYIEVMWQGSSRKKLRQQMRGLYNKYTIEIINNNYNDLDRLFDLNIKRFGDSSSLSTPRRRQIFRNLSELYSVEMISIRVDGKVESVSYGINYKQTYIGMNAGTNTDIQDLGKLLVLLQIGRAIQLGCTAYDGGKGSGVWKEEFKFNKIPQYLLRLP